MFINRLVIIALLMCGLVSSAHARKLFVANDGLDSDTCGSKASACRSISSALQKAQSGDTIIVGPGLYGDINFDGDLDDAGDESGVGSDEAMISIDFPVRIFSRDGAHTTVLVGPDTFEYILYLKANGIRIGKKRGGLTVKGGTRSAVFVEGSNVAINASKLYSADGAGLIAGCETTPAEEVDQSETYDFRGFPANGRILNSELNHNGGHGVDFCSNTSGWVVKASELAHNSGYGLKIKGSAHRFLKNLLVGNFSGGTRGDETENVRIVNSHVVANRGSGVSFFDASGVMVKKNSIVGNAGVGLFTTTRVDIAKSNIFGNHPRGASELYINCGLFDNSPESDSTTVKGIYWGASTGPGQEPADQLCTQVKLFPDELVQNFAKSERKIKVTKPVK